MAVFLQTCSLNDRRDFDRVQQAMRTLGYTTEEVGTIWKLLGAILHLVSGQRCGVEGAKRHGSEFLNLFVYFCIQNPC